MGSILVAQKFKQKVLNFCKNSHMVNHSKFWYVTEAEPARGGREPSSEAEPARGGCWPSSEAEPARGRCEPSSEAEPARGGL
jgi:hypothetical protein